MNNAIDTYYVSQIKGIIDKFIPLDQLCFKNPFKHYVYLMTLPKPILMCSKKFNCIYHDLDSDYKMDLFYGDSYFEWKKMLKTMPKTKKICKEILQDDFKKEYSK